MKRITTVAAILTVIVSASALCACDITETVENSIDTYGNSEITETDKADEDSRETEKESDLNDSNITEEDETKTNDSPANDKNWTVAA